MLQYANRLDDRAAEQYSETTGSRTARITETTETVPGDLFEWVIVKSRYPIPHADELIDQLRTARVFSKIDLRGGYHQIRIEPSDCAKTAFSVRINRNE
ncbi:unnamed protein product [Closterium sp. NIES-53]